MSNQNDNGNTGASESQMPMLTLAYLNHAISWTYPIIAAQVIAMLECVRVLPAEVRMIMRAYKRRRLNAAEMLFFMIKYATVLSFSLDLTIQLTQLLQSDDACLGASWASLFFLFFASSTVVASLCWRAHIIFHRSLFSRNLLCIGLLVQIGISIYTLSKQGKFDTLFSDGTAAYCNLRSQVDPVLASRPPPPWYSLSAPWFLLYNTLFDGIIVATTTWRLLKAARGPTGFASISKRLFANGIQYSAVVCTVNLVEFIAIMAAFKKMPSLLGLSISIQVVTGMNMLISEQDAVHGHYGGMSSMVKPPQYRSDPSSGRPGFPALPLASSGASSHATSGFDSSIRDSKALLTAKPGFGRGQGGTALPSVPMRTLSSSGHGDRDMDGFVHDAEAGMYSSTTDDYLASTLLEKGELGTPPGPAPPFSMLSGTNSNFDETPSEFGDNVDYIRSSGKRANESRSFNLGDDGKNDLSIGAIRERAAELKRSENEHYHNRKSVPSAKPSIFSGTDGFGAPGPHGKNQIMVETTRDVTRSSPVRDTALSRLTTPSGAGPDEDSFSTPKRKPMDPVASEILPGRHLGHTPNASVSSIHDPRYQIARSSSDPNSHHGQGQHGIDPVVAAAYPKLAAQQSKAHQKDKFEGDRGLDHSYDPPGSATSQASSFAAGEPRVTISNRAVDQFTTNQGGATSAGHRYF
ncbi:hypothetical protein CBOM_00375 [Ceraceosorus bombacis]|uniref:Uncharacterized protein n=1 Tax=Ceraceosorus bombacis TaxID=401625 RepID=A0A0P1BAX0_9BASI|nr:hypothetical protein CBOM_00375 [Ceraceosorus bombacis]